MSVSQISLADFLSRLQEIAAEAPSYRIGGSAKDGTCDCIGLIIGAIRRAGGSWPGIHGSNYAARNEVQSMTEIRRAEELSVGELVFKHRKPGNKGYSLSERYKNSSDRNDYYHVGVVLSVSPLRILHMTTPSVQTDTKPGKWSHQGWCRRISREEPEKTPVTNGTKGGENPLPEKVFIESTNGFPVKLRAEPDASCRLYWEIPSGAQGKKLSEEADWCRIETSDLKGKTRIGWMKSDYVVPAPGEAASGSRLLTAEELLSLLTSMAEIERHLDAIYEVLGGRG